MQIILSSNNAKKIEELKAILGNEEVKGYQEFLKEIEIIEDAMSFEENAFLKARGIFDLLELEGDFVVLADDSGLCVEALGGMPAIYSSRFADIKENAHQILQNRFIPPKKSLGDTQNNLKLLECLNELKINTSKAKFVCVIAMCARIKGERIEKSFCGELLGEVKIAPLNPLAFGYDPLFVPLGYKETLDQIKEKNTFSHRFLALKQVKSFLENHK